MDTFFVGKPAQLDNLLRANPPIAVSAVTLTGYDANDAVVSTLSSVTGSFTPSTEAAEILLSYGWASPVLGQYRLEWLVTYVGGAQETFLQEMQVVANPPAGGKATYDPATTTGQARFWSLDTDVSNPRWSDTEIGLALTTTGDDPIQAALLLLNLKAIEFAEQAVIVKTQSESIDLRAKAEQMDKRIKFLDGLATESPYVDPPSRVFVPLYPDGRSVPTQSGVNGPPYTNMEPW